MSMAYFGFKQLQLFTKVAVEDLDWVCCLQFAVLNAFLMSSVNSRQCFFAPPSAAIPVTVWIASNVEFPLWKTKLVEGETACSFECTHFANFALEGNIFGLFGSSSLWIFLPRVDTRCRAPQTCPAGTPAPPSSLCWILQPALAPSWSATGFSNFGFLYLLSGTCS